MTSTSSRLRPARTTVAALASLALLALGGCGGSANGESGDALTDVDLVFDGALTVCTDMPYAPFEYEEKGKPVGFDIDVIRKVADELDAELDVVDQPFDDIVSGDALNEGVCDVAISAMTITGERARALDFSSPYFDAKQALITPRGSGTDTLEELAEQRVGVQANTTGETFIEDFAPSTVEILTYDDAESLERAVTVGAIDAAMLDNTAASEIVAGSTGLKIARDFETGEQYGIAVQKDGNIPLLRRINTALSTMREDGSHDKIYAKYFG